MRKSRKKRRHTRARRHGDTHARPKARIELSSSLKANRPLPRARARVHDEVIHPLYEKERGEAVTLRLCALYRQIHASPCKYIIGRVRGGDGLSWFRMASNVSDVVHFLDGPYAIAEAL